MYTTWRPRGDGGRWTHVQVGHTEKNWKMMTRQERLVPLPDNILSFSVQQGRWNDIGVDITEAHCAGRVLHPLCY